MAEFVVACHFEYHSYNKFRVVNTVTREVKDISSIDLYHDMINGPNFRRIANLRVKGDSFEWIQGSWDRMGLMDKDGNVTVNEKALVVVNIDGEFVEVANVKGQIIRAHMLQVVNNIRMKKFYLVNAEVELSGRIKMTYNKKEGMRYE